MIPILLTAAVTLLGSFLCSLFEAVLYALRPARIEVMRRERVPGAERLARLRANIDEPIAAILTINTITHTAGAAACGALVGERFGNRAVGVFAAVFTLAVLFFTEIIPKSYGVKHAARLGPRIAWPLQLMIWAVWPVVKGSAWFMKLFSGHGEGGAVSEDELVIAAGIAAKRGNLRSEEHRWVRNSLQLDRATAGDLLTPRSVVQSLPAETRLDELDVRLPLWVHSRLPVTRGGDLDSIEGVVLRRDVVDALVRGERERTLAEFVHPLLFVRTDTAGHELLAQFVRERRHLFGVRDELGTFAGVITLEDVLEFLIGQQIVDEHDQVTDLQAKARDLARRAEAPES